MITVILRINHLVAWRMYAIENVGELTVRQMLMYTAELRLPTTAPTKDKVARVDETIARLDLSSCTNTVIGNALQRGISGGQAKRVNLSRMTSLSFFLFTNEYLIFSMLTATPLSFGEPFGVGNSLAHSKSPSVGVGSTVIDDIATVVSGNSD